MSFQLNVFSFTLLLAGLATAAMAVLLLRRLEAVVWWFGVMMLTIAIWAVSYGFELSSNTLDKMLFWVNLEYLGVALVPAFWIVFVLHYIGKEHWLTRLNVSLVFSVPALTLLLVWTNHWHHLHYVRVSVDPNGPFPMLVIKPGMWYRVHTIYFYLMLAWGNYLIVSAFSKADAVYRKQHILILIGAFLPWLANLIYLLEVRPFKYIDLTPYALMITALMVSFGLFRLKLFDLIPVAREKVIEAMREGVLVL
ncbi:MAG: histidine kinase N-terminal 7TM domain-containing protein, partial [Bacteroidota bacterium]